MEKEKYYENIANTIINNLKNRQREGYYYYNKEDAVQKALDLISKENRIGWGGSKTVEECGLIELLQNKGCRIIDRSKAITVEEQRRTYGEICECDFFSLIPNRIKIILIGQELGY